MYWFSVVRRKSKPCARMESPIPTPWCRFTLSAHTVTAYYGLLIYDPLIAINNSYWHNKEWNSSSMPGALSNHLSWNLPSSDRWNEVRSLGESACLKSLKAFVTQGKKRECAKNEERSRENASSPPPPPPRALYFEFALPTIYVESAPIVSNSWFFL